MFKVIYITIDWSSGDAFISTYNIYINHFRDLCMYLKKKKIMFIIFSYICMYMLIEILINLSKTVVLLYLFLILFILVQLLLLIFISISLYNILISIRCACMIDNDAMLKQCVNFKVVCYYTNKF